MEWPSIATQGILIVYGLLNLTALSMFFVDKRSSVAGRQRVRESTLLMSAFFGPFGAYAGMRLFRHKTRKFVFVLVPLFMALHAVLIVYLVIFV